MTNPSRSPAAKIAYNQVKDAIRLNQLTRPDTCELCKRTRDCIVAHHWQGHRFPLSVWWVCNSCNGKLRGERFHNDTVSKEQAIEFVTPKHKPKKRRSAPVVPIQKVAGVLTLRDALGDNYKCRRKPCSVAQLISASGVSPEALIKMIDGDYSNRRVATIMKAWKPFNAEARITVEYIDPIPTATTTT